MLCVTGSATEIVIGTEETVEVTVEETNQKEDHLNVHLEEIETGIGK